MAVNITEGGSGIEYKNQQRSDKSTQRGVLGEDGENEVLMPRFIYSKLGNYTNQKTITIDDMETENNEYKFFIMQMQRLAEMIRRKEIPSKKYENIQKLDEYLGGLGTDEFYPFADDIYGMVPWLNVETKSEFRNVISKKRGTNGIETNVITSIAGEDYNIIHKS